jgi:hypothetical protein
MVKPLLLQTEFDGIHQRLALPPALPNEPYLLDDEK